MGLLAFFRRTPATASVAKERLRIIVAQERSARGGPDYLPLLRREILEVIRKYVNVDPDAIDIHVEKDGSLKLYLQCKDPGGAKSANWLPSPCGKFSATMRLYLPTAAALAPSFTLPPLS